MKKMIVAVAVMMSVGFASQAFADEKSATCPVATVVAGEGYEEAKLEDLSEGVQKAVAALSEANEVKALAYNAEKKLTKVTLVSKEDQTEKTVVLNEEGEEIAE